MFSVTRHAKRISFLCFIAFVLMLGLNYESLKQLHEHRYFIYEQDAYMHLVLAHDFLQNPNLHEHFNYRINTPWGSDTHGWTNLVTLLLAGGALVLKLLLPLNSALYLWAFFLPLIANLVALWAMIWAIKPMQPNFYQLFFIVLAFLINPFLHSYFLPLRVDYDFLLIPTSIFYWGYLLRLLTKESPKKAITTGLIACLGLWTSISFMLPLLLGLLFLFWQNLNNKIKNKTFYCFLLSLIAGLIPIIFMEQSPFFTQAYDIISIVHLTFFILVLTSYALFQIVDPPSLAAKITLIIVLAVLLFCCMNFLFPGFYLGPYNQVLPFLLKHLFPNVSEFHSPFAIDNALALALLCYFFIGAGYFYFLVLTEGLSPQQVLLLFSAFILTAITAYMYRWCIFSLPLTIWLSSFWLGHLKSNKLLKLGILLFMVFLPSFILSLAKNYTNPEQQMCEKQLYSMLHHKLFNQAQFSQDKSLFIHNNYGPLLLYATNFSIVATNDHHNPQGVEDSYYFFKGKEAIAKQIAVKRQINLILLCPTGYSLGFNPQNSNWLKAIPLPNKYSKWQLYRRID